MVQKLFVRYLYTPEGIRKGKWLLIWERASAQWYLREIRQGSYLESTISVDDPWIVTPGLFNLHCHLDLSFTKGKIRPQSGMLNFLLQVYHARKQYKGSIEIPVQQALKAAFHSGTQMIVDIAAAFLSPSIKLHTPIATHTCIELIALSEEDYFNRKASLEKFYEAYQGLSVTISPHAPYSVCPQALAAHSQWVQHHGGVQSIHCLESKEEVEAFACYNDFIHFKNKVASVFPPHPVTYLIQFWKVPKTLPVLFVHLLQANHDTIAQLLEHYNAYFVLCPRSNAFIQGQVPKWEIWQHYLDRTGLGTDSLASNVDLNLWNEVRFLLRQGWCLTTQQALDLVLKTGIQLFSKSHRVGLWQPNTRRGALAIHRSLRKKPIRIF